MPHGLVLVWLEEASPGTALLELLHDWQAEELPALVGQPQHLPEDLDLPVDGAVRRAGLLTLADVLRDLGWANGNPPKGKTYAVAKAEGTLQESSAWWVKYYVNGKPFRESAGTEKETEARRFLKEREGRVADGRPILPRVDRVLYQEKVALTACMRKLLTIPERHGQDKHQVAPPRSTRNHLTQETVANAVENELHKEVCAGTLTLQEAQHIIAIDWFEYYRDHALK